MSVWTIDLGSAIPGMRYDVKLRDSSVLMGCWRTPARRFMYELEPEAEFGQTLWVRELSIAAIRPSEGA